MSCQSNTTLTARQGGFNSSAHLEPARDPWDTQDTLGIEVSRSLSVNGSHRPKENPGLSLAWLLAVHVTDSDSSVPTCVTLTHTFFLPSLP